MSTRGLLLLMLLVLGLLTWVPPVEATNYSFKVIDYPGAQVTEIKHIDSAGSLIGGYFLYKQYHSFTMRNDTYSSFDTPFMGFEGINDYGQAVQVTVDVYGFSHGAYWDGVQGHAYKPFDLDLGTSTSPEGINNFGIITGASYTHDFSHGFVLNWLDGSYTTLDFPGSSYTGAKAINDKGQVVGKYSDATGFQHGFFWDASGGYTSIDPPDSIKTTLTGINNKGWIMGYYLDNSSYYHAFVLNGSGGKFTEINAATPFMNFVNNDPTSINDQGQIAGSYIDSNGITHGFVATPISVTPALGLLLSD